MRTSRFGARLGARVLQGVVVGSLLLGSAAPAYATSYSAIWSGSRHVLAKVPNQTVEGFADATLVGTVSDFQTDDPSQSCLNGSTLNVWTAPAEYPGSYVVHNGWQGPQCTYGTWLIGASYFYQGTFNGAVRILNKVPNQTVENLTGAVRVLAITNFQTNDPSQSCLNGSTINVFLAPVQFGANWVAHNGLQGSQCTYGTWTFPIP
jgi:hypothetical protein